jgi:hypothetical protein
VSCRVQDRTDPERDEHDGDGQLEGGIKPRWQLGTRHHQDGADDEKNHGMPDAPRNRVRDARPQGARLGDHGRDCDDMVRFERVPQPLKEAEEQAEEDRHGRQWQ